MPQTTHIPKPPDLLVGLCPLEVKGRDMLPPMGFSLPTLPSPPPASPLPHVVMFLDVNLMEHHILLFGIDVCFHLHGDMTGKDRQQEPLLEGKQMLSS